MEPRNCQKAIIGQSLDSEKEPYLTGISGMAKQTQGGSRLYTDFQRLEWFALPVFYYMGAGFDLESDFWKNLKPSDFMDEFDGLLLMQGMMGALAILMNQGPPLILRQYAAWCWYHAVPEKELRRVFGSRDPAAFAQYVRALGRVRLAPNEEIGSGVGPHDPWAFAQFVRTLRWMPVPPEADTSAAQWASICGDSRLDGLSPEVLQTRPRDSAPLSWAIQYFGKWQGNSWKGLQAFLVQQLDAEMPAILRRLLTLAIRESLLFERFGFGISRCQHGGHWYVSDDRRRKDCIVHRLAGQQARWRQQHPTWKLKVGHGRRRGFRTGRRSRV